MTSAVFLIIAIVAVGLLALLAIVFRGNSRHNFNKEEYQTRWLKIENGLKKSEPSSYTVSVIEADKLLDRALRELGISGKTMGERLKKLNDKLPNINKIWYAHKIRNQLAHEDDFQIDYTTASRALATFKTALKDLGAI